MPPKTIESHHGFGHTKVDHHYKNCENCPLQKLRNQFNLAIKPSCSANEHAMIACKGELKEAGYAYVFEPDQLG